VIQIHDSVYGLIYTACAHMTPRLLPRRYIQFNSNTLFKDGDPVSLQLIFPGAITTCKQIQHFFIHIYKTTQVHRTNTGIVFIYAARPSNGKHGTYIAVL